MLPGFFDFFHDLATLGRVWGLIPGPRELALLAVLALALYGRSETVRRAFARLIRPTFNGSAGSKVSPRWGDRWFLVVGMVASAAVAAWVVTWMIVVHRPAGP